MRNFFNAIDPSFAGFIVLCIIGICAGFVVGICMADDLAHDVLQRDEIERACVEGNDRACRLYEVKYGR